MTARTSRLAPYAGIAFVACFVASTTVSSPPKDEASNATWVASYTGHSAQARHLATGLLLVVAGLLLMTFLVALHRRIAVRRPDASRLPLAAAGAAAAGLGAGGAVMGYISGGELVHSYPLPNVDLLRLSNDLGFAIAGVAGLWAAALAVGVLSVQAHAAGLMGARMRTAGLIAAALQVFSILFIPVIALLLWTLVASISWIRSGEPAWSSTDQPLAAPVGA